MPHVVFERYVSTPRGGLPVLKSLIARSPNTKPPMWREVRDAAPRLRVHGYVAALDELEEEPDPEGKAGISKRKIGMIHVSTRPRGRMMT